MSWPMVGKERQRIIPMAIILTATVGMESRAFTKVGGYMAF